MKKIISLYLTVIMLFLICAGCNHNKEPMHEESLKEAPTQEASVQEEPSQEAPSQGEPTQETPPQEEPPLFQLMSCRTIRCILLRISALRA